MMVYIRQQWAFLILGSVLASLGLVLSGTGEPIEDEKNLTGEVVKQESDNDFPAVDNMHHFMEYISQPAYRQLKSTLETEPENRRAWKAVKSPALVLAETSAIVAERTPEGATEEQIKEWKAISVDVYNSAKALYKSAGDYEKAKQHYSVMIDNCNRCHQVFEDGRHQLAK